MNKINVIKVVKQQKNLNTASVIFLHGSGDTGPGILDWIKFLVGDINFPHIKFLFPTAPERPYTPIGGQLSTVWFDRLDIRPTVPEHAETLESIGLEVKNLIENETKSGIPLNRIIVGGFSMGGALALHMAYRFTPGLAGVFALSSFLNDNSAVYSALKDRDEPAINTPLFMRHGSRDSLVPLDWGKATHDKLVEYGAKPDFAVLKNTLHELKKEEIADLLRWISDILPEKNNE